MKMNNNIKIARQLVRMARELVALNGNEQDAHFSPASENAFFNPYNAGDGVVIYEVEDSKEGQLAVRKAIDVNWGYDKNPWCLAARKDGFDPDEVEQLTDEQKKKLGLYSEDVLAVAWKYWNQYNAYPKRIAFKNGKLLAFSAGDEDQHIEWWDKNDESHYTIPGSDAVDDIEFLKRHGKLNLVDSQNASPEMLEELAEDEYGLVKRGVAMNPNTHVEVLRKLAEDEDDCVRNGAAKNPNTPAEVLKTLSEDEEWYVREGVAVNPSAPVEVIMTLADDKKWNVREGVTKNPNTPVEIIMKLAEDEDWIVRQRVAENPSTPVDALMKLAEDKNEYVREAVAHNRSTPAEIIRKLANDESRKVRESAKGHLKQ